MHMEPLTPSAMEGVPIHLVAKSSRMRRRCLPAQISILETRKVRKYFSSVENAVAILRRPVVVLL